MMNSQVAKLSTLRTVGAVGFTIFVVFFSFTYAVPDWVESYAADFIESEVKKKIDTSINDLEPPEGESALSRLAANLYQHNADEIERLKNNLKSEAHEQMAIAIAQMRNLDCECREKWARLYQDGFIFELSLLQAANDQLVDFIHSSYHEVVADLKHDIRIFTGVNALVFLLVILIPSFKPTAITHLFLPGVLLVTSTIICSYFYIFEQNWLLTIIYNDYWGFAYLSYLFVVFMFLLDILTNRGRVTTTVLNGVSSAVGAAASVVPC